MTSSCRTTRSRTTDRTKVRRLADRGRYDWDTIHSILDEGLCAISASRSTVDRG